MKRITVLLAAIVAIGCSSGETEHRMGSSGLAPGMFRIIPVSLDPSSGGLPGAVGDIVQGADGLHAWQRSGSNVTDWTPIPVSAATPSTAGLLTAAQATSLGSIPGNSLSVGIWRTPVIDLTTPATTAFDMPVVAGASFHPTGQMRLEILTRDAALTTALSWDITQNGVGVGAMTGLSLATASMNAFTAPDSFAVSPLTFNIPSLASFPLQIKITTGVGGSGLTTCTGRFVAVGFYSAS